MMLVIMLIDQLLFRPLVVWADGFRFEQTARQVPPSWFLQVHTWPATGITILPEERRTARARPADGGHESPRTTKPYDRTKDEITLSEVERIRL
jgi:hypothetical protein